MEFLPGDGMKIVSEPHWNAYRDLAITAAALAMEVQAQARAPAKLKAACHRIIGLANDLGIESVSIADAAKGWTLERAQ